LTRYLRLARAFGAREMSAQEFSDATWDLFKEDRDSGVEWGVDYSVLNDLVLSAEAFEADALEENYPWEVTERALRSAAARAVRELRLALDRTDRAD